MGESGHKTIVCIASGPSLTKDDCDIAQAADMVIAVNDSYRMVPDAAAMYACDERWWNVHLESVRQTFKGDKYTKYRTEAERRFALDRGLIPIKGRAGHGLGRHMIHFGNNSGYQAINLAYLLSVGMGITPRLLLLGYDMQAIGNKTHWFGSHQKNGLRDGPYHAYVSHFDALARDLESEGIEVINCTRETALYQFPRAPIESCIERVEG